ncbi:flavodoxin reductase [Terrimonas pollutisoli]|uniref:flavodoxin reductase n=1 Tax=Terrimonas pollutisoli TaxID=3034147 RepID=UPI0023ECD687|nr:flavodoxin reductase [Terrimonas sp. H1YJ31]
MESHIVRIESIGKISHDVLRIVTHKPCGYFFKPGQATEVSINKGHWRKEKRAFTFTGLPDDPFLEFTIKTYPSHKGVTNQLLSLIPGDELILQDAWGAISYQGEGVFIAGGAGITPFLSIFRQLAADNSINNNRLIFANKTKADIIHEQELKKLLGSAVHYILSEEIVPGFEHGFITKDFLKKNLPASPIKIYVCGPPPMLDSVLQNLSNLGVGDDALVAEL